MAQSAPVMYVLEVWYPGSGWADLGPLKEKRGRIMADRARHLKFVRAGAVEVRWTKIRVMKSVNGVRTIDHPETEA